MAINISSTGEILKDLLYGDKMSVYRYIQEIKEDGSKVSNINPNKVLEDVPCKLSFSSLDSSNIGEMINGVEYITKIFVGLEYEIKSGDILEVERIKGKRQEIYKGYAGKPNIYDNHQEIELIEKKKS
nr:MAG TPA: head closure knob [Caudoviricetes sp.]